MGWWVVSLTVSGWIRPSGIHSPLSPTHVVSGFGHVTCFGQLDIRKCEASRSLRSMWELGSPSWNYCHHVSKLTVVPWLMKDHVEKDPFHSAVLAEPSPRRTRQGDEWAQPQPAGEPLSQMADCEKQHIVAVLSHYVFFFKNVHLNNWWITEHYTKN